MCIALVKCLTSTCTFDLWMSKSVATLALGSRPRQGVARLRAKGKPIVMPHALGSARECVGIDPHTPKGTPTLGVGVPHFQSMISGVKTHRIEKLFISLEIY
jgi:hypothetical protein